MRAYDDDCAERIVPPDPIIDHETLLALDRCRRVLATGSPATVRRAGARIDRARVDGARNGGARGGGARTDGAQRATAHRRNRTTAAARSVAAGELPRCRHAIRSRPRARAAV